MNDYELYRILEANGYDTTNDNLAILKEGLESGEIVLNEANNDNDKIEKDVRGKIDQRVADDENDTGSRKRRALRFLKRAGGIAAGAVIGAGLGGTAGALTGNAMDSKVVSDAQGKLDAAIKGTNGDGLEALKTAKDTAAATAAQTKDDLQKISDKIDANEYGKASIDIGASKASSDNKPSIKVTTAKTDGIMSKEDSKLAQAEREADIGKKGELTNKLQSDEDAVSAADTAYQNKQNEVNGLQSKVDAAKADHHRRKWMTAGGVAGGALAGGNIGYAVSKKTDSHEDQAGDAVYEGRKKTEKAIKKALDKKHKTAAATPVQEMYDILDANGFEPTEYNISVLRENNAIILSTEDIVLTEGMAPEYALMKLLDANGFEPTAENVRVLNAGLDSGSILLK